jgi:hypothetical protein
MWICEREIPIIRTFWPPYIIGISLTDLEISWIRKRIRGVHVHPRKESSEMRQFCDFRENLSLIPFSWYTWLNKHFRTHLPQRVAGVECRHLEFVIVHVERYERSGRFAEILIVQLKTEPNTQYNGTCESKIDHSCLAKSPNIDD